MRQNMFGERYAQPTDTADDVYAVSGVSEFTAAEVYEEADENFGHGGELRNDDGESFKFDGFESREALEEWLQAQFGIGESDIELM